jgi:hypothetical protein
MRTLTRRGALAAVDFTADVAAARLVCAAAAADKAAAPDALLLPAQAFPGVGASAAALVIRRSVLTGADAGALQLQTVFFICRLFLMLGHGVVTVTACAHAWCVQPGCLRTR